MKPPISFPSEAAQLRKRLEAQAGATAEARLLAAARALSAAGGRWREAEKYHDRCKQQWRDRMKEVIARHVGPAPQSDR